MTDRTSPGEEMDYNACNSLTALFFDKARELGDKPFLWAKRDGAYQPLTWRQVEAAVRDLSRGLRSLGLGTGDRVVLVAENRPEWFIADLAIMAAGAITVPAYTTNGVGDHLHILTHSGAKGAIVSTRALAGKLLPAAVEAPACDWVVSIDDLESHQEKTMAIHRWDAVLEAGRAQPDDVDEIVARAKRGDTACFIYTSGTGGTPKGVMLSHGSMLCNCKGAYETLKYFHLGEEVFLCFLPLSHSYEHTGGQFFPMSLGAQIYYAENIDKLLNNLAEARPTLMTAVPRLYESMQQRLRRAIEKEGGMKAKLFALAEKLGRKRYEDPKSLTFWERIQDALVDRLVRDKVRARFGGRMKAMVSGGAALNPDIGIFFTALGLRILQGYGQTEAAPVIAINPPGRIKMDTVGLPTCDIDVKIAEDGEILARGELVMNGYWQDEEATAAAIQDGWLHTGDIGEFDSDGYLKITDRKKDIIVFSGGDNVSPARVESFLTLRDEIGQAMVFGDKRPNLVALLVPDTDFLKDWARQQGRQASLAELHEDKDLRKVLSAVVDEVNKELSPLEKVRRFTLALEPFTTDNHMLTPTMKIRRHKIKESYGAALDALYERKSGTG